MRSDTPDLVNQLDFEGQVVAGQLEDDELWCIRFSYSRFVQGKDSGIPYKAEGQSTVTILLVT